MTIERLTPSKREKRMWAVLEDATLTAVQKCIGLAVILSADDDGKADVTTRDLLRYSSTRDRDTVFRATAVLTDHGYLNKLSSNGQSGSYSVLPARVIEAVEKAYGEMKTGPVKPDGFDGERSGQTLPVRTDEPVRSNPTGPVKPVRFQPTGPVSTDRSLARADSNITTTYSTDNSEIITTVGDLGEGGPEGEPNLFDSEPEKPKRATPRPKPSVEQFDRFWSAYPRRKGKPKAMERFMALTPEQAERAVAAANAYAEECATKGVEEQFQKWPQGWLSERRFDDETPATAPLDSLVGPNGKKWGWWRGKEAALRALSSERWRDGVSAAKPNGTWPWWVLGPPPGHDDCLLPPEIAAPFVEIYRGKIHHA